MVKKRINNKSRSGEEKWLSRQAHDLKKVGSIPTSALNVTNSLLLVTRNTTIGKAVKTPTCSMRLLSRPKISPLCTLLAMSKIEKPWLDLRK